MSEAADGLSEALACALPVYEIPDDDLVGEVLIPAMNVSTAVRVGAGFFSSHCLAQIAPGLASFIASGSQPLELLVSPEISVEDRDAIDRGLSNPDEVIEEATRRLLADAQLSPSALVRHTLDCLAYLVASGRLELRFVLMQRGMYHKKMWLFYDGNAWAAVHGSGNATTRGLLVNGEQMTVDRPWMDGQSVTKRVELLVRQWDRQWNNENPNSLTLLAPQGLRLAERHGSETRVPTVRDFWDAWRADHESGLEPDLPPNYRSAPAHVLQIPVGMEWRTGPFRHQGAAVDSYLDANGRGVLEIATGGGKTRTALICATETQERHQGPMLLLILVPSKPLMLQWADDVREFGIDPLLPSEWSPDNRRVRFEEIRAGLAGGERRTEVLIATNHLFAQDESLRALIDDLAADTATMLVGDEMHNLGTPTFLNNLPERFDNRLGLSATPVRQYDPDGTDKLFDFFGRPVFEFSLADAIEADCLTRYRYYLHEVRLTDDEMNKYTELCEELKAAGFRLEDDGRIVVSNPRIERLLRERRAVLEQATGKIDQLESLLQEQGTGNVQRTLIYTSAKPTILGGMRQIEDVNELLSRLGIISHQFTNAETSCADAKKLLDRFGQGDYQVLTAMKVLDEGIDIPQTDTAYLLASSTVRREWVQRRGRILRKAVGKEVATLHDFLVIPPDPGSDEGKAILRGELRRAEEFARLAVNEWANDGPRLVLSKYD